MKRALLASILGIAASVASTYGAGHIYFSTYFSSSSMVQVRYHSPGNAVVGPGFQAEIFYGLGSSVNFYSMTALPGSITTVGSEAPGLIIGGNVDVPNYVSGPITFAIVAFNGTGWNNGTSGLETLPWDVQTWTEPSITAGIIPPQPFTYALMPAQIWVGVPEPSTIALAGAGAAALLIFRKRQ